MGITVIFRQWRRRTGGWYPIHDVSLTRPMLPIQGYCILPLLSRQRARRRPSRLPRSPLILPRMRRSPPPGTVAARVFPRPIGMRLDPVEHPLPEISSR